MICGYLPFEDPDTNKLYNKILKCEYSIPDDVSSNARDLITKILNTDPGSRYNLEKIRAHPWFVENTHKSLKLNVVSS
jgi:serine/threonine protein kinase